MKLFTNTNSIFATVFVMVVTCTQWVIADERLYVYPNDGQDKEQIGQDRYECHRWAVDETGFDPTDFDQPAPPDLVVVPENPKRGATGIGIITGAVIGGVLGSMDHHTGTGTGVAIGGVIGGVAGAAVESEGGRQAREEAESQAAVLGEQKAELALRRSNYQRALAACLKGRGYTVR
jgi:hypothetical protein